MQMRVAVVGATGMVGQRFISLLQDHPWFKVVVVAASSRSVGKTYAEAVEGRWWLPAPPPPEIAALVVQDGWDVGRIAQEVELVFCAVDLPPQEVRRLEEAFARMEVAVVSNNSAHRSTPDVPMVIPEVNPHHLEVLPAQRRRLGTRRGFVVVKPNCSIQSYVPALHPLLEFGPESVAVCTYQALSGAGRTLSTWPEMEDNVLPYIRGEEEKSEQEPLRIWGTVVDGTIRPATSPRISAQCIRVPVSEGHLAAVSVTFREKPSADEVIKRWRSYRGRPQKLGLPGAPEPFLQYFDEVDRPQTRLDRDAGNGMAISIGRLREDRLFDYRFVCLSHNTVRGAAGGAILTAELLKAEGWLDA